MMMDGIYIQYLVIPSPDSDPEDYPYVCCQLKNEFKVKGFAAGVVGNVGDGFPDKDRQF